MGLLNLSDTTGNESHSSYLCINEIGKRVEGASKTKYCSVKCKSRARGTAATAEAGGQYQLSGTNVLCLEKSSPRAVLPQNGLKCLWRGEIVA